MLKTLVALLAVLSVLACFVGCSGGDTSAGDVANKQAQLNKQADKNPNGIGTRD